MAVCPVAETTRPSNPPTTAHPAILSANRFHRRHGGASVLASRPEELTMAGRQGDRFTDWNPAPSCPAPPRSARPLRRTNRGATWKAPGQDRP